MLSVGLQGAQSRLRPGFNKARTPTFPFLPNSKATNNRTAKPRLTDGCSQDLCPAAAHLSHLAGKASTQSPFATKATHHVNAVTATEAQTDKKWWKEHADVWEEIRDADHFEQVISSGDKMVFVEFFATWCHACQKAFPEISRIVQDPDLRKHFKFCKMNADIKKSLMKREEIKALPMAKIYRPGHGAMLSLDTPFSKLRHLRTNLQIIIGNPDMSFKTDPNGFVVAIPASQEQKDKDIAAAQKAEIEKLTAQRGSLFERLKDVAGLGSSSSSSGKPTPSSNTPASSTSSSTSTSSSGGASSGNIISALDDVDVTASSSIDLSLPALDAHKLALEKQIFLKRHRAEYGYNSRIDELYQREVGCRMRQGEHYLDYTGSSVYCQSQLDQVFKELRSCMFGNPHSANPSSSLTSEKVEEVREMILKYFNADPTEYLVVFTRSATGALKLAGETFPWSRNGMFRYLRENHNSVLGIREYALQAGAPFQAVDEKFVADWLMTGQDSSSNGHNTTEPGYSLFAFPAEDNFAGVKYPLKWVEGIKAKSTPSHQWRVLIDAAAYVPTQPLDLTEVKADFVTLSFYKMFGYPTGLGALIVRASVVEELHKVFWGGGTVALATSEDNFHVLKCRPSDKLEDGTVNFLDVIALKHGFKMLEQLGGISRVQSHVASLTEWLYNKMIGLRHSNGRPVVTIFGKHGLPNSRAVQGGIVNFEVLKPNGDVFSYKTVEVEAAKAGFHVRTGAECNPGACYNYLGVKEAEVEALAGVKEGCEDDVEFITVERPVSQASAGAPRNIISSSEQLSRLVGTPLALGHPAEVAAKWVQVPLGSVRVSLGYMSTFEDCYALVEFLREKYVDRVQDAVEA